MTLVLIFIWKCLDLLRNSEPTITAPVGNTNYSEDDEIKATMTVDRSKPKDVVLKVGNIIGES